MKQGMKLHFKVDNGLHQGQYISIDMNSRCFTTVNYYPHTMYLDLSEADYSRLFKQCVECGFEPNWYL